MPPKFKDLKKYCDKDDWILARDTDHFHYEKTLSDGTILKTKISHATHKEIPKHLWKHILSKQLQITEEEFWKKIK